MSYFIFSTILFVLAFIIIYWIHNQYHLDIVVVPAPPPMSAPLVSVCIPARNEENNIRRCVEAVLGQDYPNLEVIVLDDRSTDATSEILRQLSAQNDKLKIISGSNLPEGWAGKPHALYQASAIARGEWLCFVDADTFLAPNALASVYAKAIETQADLFTIMTKQILGSFWERTVMPLVMTALSVGFSPRKVNDPSRRDAVANGQFIFIKRSIYDLVGGHEKIKNQIVEDKALSENVKWNGHRLVVANGMQVVSTRMYVSLETMWEGWTKNIYLGLRDHPSLLLLGPLNETEWEKMRQHPNYAYDMLSPIAYLRPALDIPYYHHERWDGSGYPHGLKGDQIPRVARLFAIVDVWDALRSDRPYRKQLPREQVIEYLREKSNILFEPKLVDLFLAFVESHNL